MKNLPLGGGGGGGVMNIMNILWNYIIVENSSYHNYRYIIVVFISPC